MVLSGQTASTRFWCADVEVSIGNDSSTNFKLRSFHIDVLVQVRKEGKLVASRKVVVQELDYQLTRTPANESMLGTIRNAVGNSPSLPKAAFLAFLGSPVREEDPDGVCRQFEWLFGRPLTEAGCKPTPAGKSLIKSRGDFSRR
jgi:hypothetical protein